MVVHCEYCKKVISDMPYKCKFCGEYYCPEHRLPEKHDCQKLKEYNSNHSRIYFDKVVNPHRNQYSHKANKNVPDSNFENIKNTHRQYKTREEKKRDRKEERLKKKYKGKQYKKQNKNEENNSWSNTNTKIDRDKLEEVVDSKHDFRVGRIIVIVLVLCAILFGVFYYTNLNSHPVALNNANVSLENIEEEQSFDKPPEPILEQFQLSSIEKEIIDGINSKRGDYSLSKYNINMKLAEINSEYIRIATEQGFQTADEEIGDLGERGKKANLKSSLIEANFEFDNSFTTEQIIGNIRHSNLYLEEYNGIALSVVEKDDKYYVLMDIFKNG